MVDDITRRVDLVARLRRLAFERRGAAAGGFEQRKRSRRASDSSPRFVDRIEKRGEREQAESLAEALRETGFPDVGVPGPGDVVELG